MLRGQGEKTHVNNLQSLCKPCHDRKTATGFDAAEIDELMNQWYVSVIFFSRYY